MKITYLKIILSQLTTEINIIDCEKRALEHSKIKYSKDLIRLNEHILIKIIKLCKDKKIKLFY